jgi:hypothetical protein
VVDKFNISKHPFYQINTKFRHGHSMDAAWVINGTRVNGSPVNGLPQKFTHDVILFLDIDALPLNDKAIDEYIHWASEGVLVGNIQRSNHIQNNQHTFVAPSAMAISESTFLTIGSPSAIETYRSDVGEEYTWLAEKAGIKVMKFMPLRFDAPPAESPSWALADGMPHYGRGTTFGSRMTPISEGAGGSAIETFWHNFQSFHPGQHERFMAKVAEIMGDKPAAEEAFTLTVT